MKLAIVGSRNLNITNLEDFIPDNISEIVSGGARGVDTNAREYAKKHNIPIMEFLPEYNKYGRYAPLKRNLQIIEYADYVIAFWDGKSHGTKYVIDNCRIKNIPIKVITIA